MLKKVLNVFHDDQAPHSISKKALMIDEEGDVTNDILFFLLLAELEKTLMLAAGFLTRIWFEEIAIYKSKKFLQIFLFLCLFQTAFFELLIKSIISDKDTSDLRKSQLFGPREGDW